MTLDSFCQKIKKRYPRTSRKADKLYNDYWNSLVQVPFSSYSWFESLANALNEEMKRKVPAENFLPLFKEISDELSKGQSEIVKAIDVAFVENLFWQVPSIESEPYWEIMPNNLKDLYVAFHRRKPI